MKREAADNAIAAKKGLKTYAFLNVEMNDGSDKSLGGYVGWYYVTLAVDGKIHALVESGLDSDVMRGIVSENVNRPNYFVAGALKDTDVDFVFNNVGFSTHEGSYTFPLTDAARERAEQTLSARLASDVAGGRAEPEQPGTAALDLSLPDPSCSVARMIEYGYTQEDMYPLSRDRALELFDTDHTVYMLYGDNTEAMAFDRDEIITFGGDGLYGIAKADWEISPVYTAQKKIAESGEAAKETALLESAGDAYGIYQIRDGDGLHTHRFASLDQLNAEGNSVDRANYTLAYTAPLEPGVTLIDLFALHNQDDRPAGREMRSMSVSDVVVLRRDGNITSHYVDIADFAELPSFLGVERQQAERQTYSQPGNTPEPERPAVPDGPSVAELEARVNAGQTISLNDLAHAVNRERDVASNRAKPSILAQLHDSKKTAAQGEDSAKSAPKRDNEREV
jgi:hypothetical protein